MLKMNFLPCYCSIPRKWPILDAYYMPMQANNELAAIIAISYSYSMGHGIYGSKPTQVQLPD